IADGNRPHFVLLSSLAARYPQISDYAASKLAGEAELTRLEGELPWSILRPPAVYGPGDRETLAFFRAMRLGFAIRPPVPDARISLLHVGDLASAIAALLDAPCTISAPLEVDDGQGGYGWDDMITVAARHVGVRPLRLAIPGAFLMGIAHLNEALHRATGDVAMLTPGKVREMLHSDWRSRDGAMTAATGWLPQIDLDKGFAETVAWYRRNRWL